MLTLQRFSSNRLADFADPMCEPNCQCTQWQQADLLSQALRFLLRMELCWEVTTRDGPIPSDYYPLTWLVCCLALYKQLHRAQARHVAQSVSPSLTPSPTAKSYYLPFRRLPTYHQASSKLKALDINGVFRPSTYFRLSCLSRISRFYHPSRSWLDEEEINPRFVY